MSDEYEELVDKYGREGKYELSNNRRTKIRPIHTVNVKNNENALLYVDTNSLPRINDPIYKEIENFPDFDYINSITYEMLIRTKEYKNIDNNRRLLKKEKIKLLDKLGVDFYEVRRYNTKSNPRRTHYNLRDKNIFESDYDLTIENIDNGLESLITFYLEQKQIFRRVKYQENILGMITEIQYKIDENVTFEEVFENPSSFFIPAKYDNEEPENEYKISRLDNGISLHALENEFLIYIENSIPNNIRGKIFFNFTRPLLRFKESANVDVQINLNLSKDVIIDLISELKDEFDKGEVKTPMGFFYDKNYIVKDWKRNIPFKFTKKSMSKAFFVYDLYKKIDIAFKNRINQLKKLRDAKIEEIKGDIAIKINKIENETTDGINNLTVDPKYKESSIKEFKTDLKRKKKFLDKQQNEDIKKIKNNYKFKCKTLNSEDILIELLEKHKITAYASRKYLQFMRKYIENAQYKELIIGTEIRN